MVGPPDAIPAGALEDIAYLARSVNRVRLLETLASGSYTRRDLAEQTGIARTTIGRIVNEFEERGWIERTPDGDYTATPVGIQVGDEFMPLVEAMAVVRQLGEMVAWLQGVEPSIDLHHFSDANVRRPQSVDPTEPLARYTEALRCADEFSCLVGVAPPLSFEAVMRDEVVKGDLTVEHVISEDEFAYVRDRPERVTRWREYVEAGANVYCYDGTVPCNLLVFDETVYIGKSQSEWGEPYAAIESENEVVWTWAHEIIETYRAKSKRLGPEAFVD
jgi:predicted transcriptional regulator